MRYVVGMLLVSTLLSAGCANRFKAVPPCAESDGAVAYTQDGTLRTDGLFINWQCYERMKQDSRDLVDLAK